MDSKTAISFSHSCSFLINVSAEALSDYTVYSLHVCSGASNCFSIYTSAKMLLLLVDINHF